MPLPILVTGPTYGAIPHGQTAPSPGSSPQAIAFGTNDDFFAYLFYNTPSSQGNYDIVTYVYSPDGAQTWSAEQQTEVPGLGLMKTTSVAPVAFGSTLYLFYNGWGNNGIWVTRASWVEANLDSLSSWSNGSSLVQNGATGMIVQPATSPAAVVFGSTLYVFYTGTDGNIWFTTTTDGTSWTSAQSTETNGASGMDGQAATSPAVVYDGSTLYVFYLVASSSSIGISFTSSQDGKTWAPVASVAPGGFQDMEITGGTYPSVLYRDNTLYVYYVSGEIESTTNSMVYANPYYTCSTDSGLSWEEPVMDSQMITGWQYGEIPPSPCAVSLFDLLYLFVNYGGETFWTTEAVFDQSDTASVSQYFGHYQFVLQYSGNAASALEQLLQESPEQPIPVPLNTTSPTSSLPPVDPWEGIGIFLAVGGVIVGAMLCWIPITRYYMRARARLGLQPPQAPLLRSAGRSSEAEILPSGGSRDTGLRPRPTGSEGGSAEARLRPENSSRSPRARPEGPDP